MNLNPLTWLRGSKFRNSGGTILAATREAQALGPWSATIAGQGFIPRQVNPWLYEALREAIGLLDGSINALVTLDGIIRVEGDNDALVAEIEDWIESVPINDAEAGLQAFYASQGNEMYEQGCTIGEWVASKDGRDISGLRVADSKGLFFVRGAQGLETWYRPPTAAPASAATGYETVETLLRRSARVDSAQLLGYGYRKLRAGNLLYAANAPEADNPYGTSKLRSLEFVSQVLLKIDNATGRSWERYGDPPLHLSYKTKNGKLSAEDLEARKVKLQGELAAALQAKAAGNSVDLVTAIGMLDEIAISVIGANGIALNPAEAIGGLRDQVHAKFGVPAWLLGLSDAGGAGQAERQSELVIQAAKTRFAGRKPGLTQTVATMLRLRGRTWKRGDWQLVQELPNLQDMMKRAQAQFLMAQAEQVSQRRNGDNSPGLQGIDNNLRASRGPARRKAHGTKAADDEDRGEPWAESDPRLPGIEAKHTRRQLSLWRRLAGAAAIELGFRVIDNLWQAPPDAADEWAFTPEHISPLLALGDRFIADSSDPDGPLLQATWEAWVRGAINAADELDADAGVDRFHDRVRQELATRGGELITSATGRAYRERVIAELVGGQYDGMNPVTVAARLQQRFEAGDYDWERLIRSEMAIAQSRGKRELYRENGLELYDYTTAGDDRVSDICRALAAGGPYPVDADASPVPVVDSHPNCRCSIAPHLPQ